MKPIDSNNIFLQFFVDNIEECTQMQEVIDLSLIQSNVETLFPRTQLKNNAQNDPTELLHQFFNASKFINEMCQKSLGVLLIKKLKCLHCEKTHFIFDNKEFLLNLNCFVDQKISNIDVATLISLYKEKSEVKCICSNCGNNQIHEIQYDFKPCGEFLIIILPRFDIFNLRMKNKIQILVNKRLHLSCNSYELIYQMFHLGPFINHGHYIGEVKTLNNWWQSNDSNYPKKSKVHTQSSINNYVLLYKKIPQYSLMLDKQMENFYSNFKSLKL